MAVEGALFSTGDGHFAQGDGEVCVTAVEMGAAFVVRFRVHRGEAEPGGFVEHVRRVTPGRDVVRGAQLTLELLACRRGGIAKRGLAAIDQRPVEEREHR